MQLSWEVIREMEMEMQKAKLEQEAAITSGLVIFWEQTRRPGPVVSFTLHRIAALPHSQLTSRGSRMRTATNRVRLAVVFLPI